MSGDLIAEVSAEVPSTQGDFVVCDRGTPLPAVDRPGRFATHTRCALLPGGLPVSATIRAWGAAPADLGWGRPFYVPSGTVEVAVGVERLAGPIAIGRPGLYWVRTQNALQVSGGDWARFTAAAGDPYLVDLWPLEDQFAPGSRLFDSGEPWDAAEGVLQIQHGQWWLHDGSHWPPRGDLPIPDADAPSVIGPVAAIPTLVQDTTVAVVLSFWESQPPAAGGRELGRFRLMLDSAEIAVAAFDGPGNAALVLPRPGVFEVAVTRRLEPGHDFEYERYDVRVWSAVSEG